jgi:hypothetical protein
VSANQDPCKKDQDEQKIPLKLREYLDLNKQIKDKQLVDSKTKRKNVKSVLANKPDSKGAEVPLRVVPELKQKETESENAFLNRVEHVSIVANLLNFK